MSGGAPPPRMMLHVRGGQTPPQDDAVSSDAPPPVGATCACSRLKCAARRVALSHKHTNPLSQTRSPKICATCERLCVARHPPHIFMLWIMSMSFSLVIRVA